MAINFAQGGVTVSPKMKPGVHKVYIHDVSFGPRKEGDVKQYMTLELRTEGNSHHLVNFSCSSTNAGYQEKMLFELQYILLGFMSMENTLTILSTKEVGKAFDEADYDKMWGLIAGQLQSILKTTDPKDLWFYIKLQMMVNEYNGKVTEFAGWEFPPFKDTRQKRFVITSPFIATVAAKDTLQYDPSKDMTMEKFLMAKQAAAPPKPQDNTSDINSFPGF